MTDKQLMQEIRERWRAVEAVEIEEQRAATVAVRLEQLNAILRLAMGLGLPLTKPDNQEEVVRVRWAKLKGSLE